MAFFETLPTLNEAFDKWKEALEDDEEAAPWPERIQEACRARDYQGLVDMDPFPSFEARRNILHFIIFESDGDFEGIEEKFRYPVVKAMVETAPDEKRRKEFVRKPDANDVTPLQMAAMEGHVHIVDYLIKQGALINTRNRSYKTPLHWAAEHARADVVSLLLKELALNKLAPKQYITYNNDLRSPLESLNKLVEEGEVADDQQVSRTRDLLRSAIASETYVQEEQELLSKMLRSHIVALGDSDEDDIQLVFHKQVNELLWGSQPLLEVMCDRLKDKEAKDGGEDEEEKGEENEEAKIPKARKRWRAYGVSLPQRNLEWVKRSAKIILESKAQLARDRVMKFIEHMVDSGKLRTPGYYPAPLFSTPKFAEEKATQSSIPPKEVNAVLKDVYCIVLPILDASNRENLQRRRYRQKEAEKHLTDVWQKLNTHLRKRTPIAQSEVDRHELLTKILEKELAEAEVAKRDALFTEQSLDEYCHNFLSNEVLDERDRSQVVSRYTEHHKSGPNAIFRDTDDRKSESDDIVAVSEMWIWRFGEFLICNYGNDEDPAPLRDDTESKPQDILLMDSNSNHPHQNLSQELFKPDRSFSSKTPEDPTMGILQAIMEACVRYEPCFPRNRGCELLDGAGAFASEIAYESSEVTKAFNKYKDNLLRVDKDYKQTVQTETEILQNLDDALGELAMIRRVHEDLRLLCMDRLNLKTCDKPDLTRWAERGESKLLRLEDDASRVRKSLATFLTLKQGEVNAESLISSKDQSRILFVFTASTVLFTPLSWISSLMALNIKNFSPEDSAWSISAAATASIVTLIGSVALILVTLQVMGWWDQKRDDRRQDKKRQGSNGTPPDPVEGKMNDPSCGGKERGSASGFPFRRGRQVKLDVENRAQGPSKVGTSMAVARKEEENGSDTVRATPSARNQENTDRQS